MKDLAGKFERKKHLRMDYCAGTCPTAKGCVLPVQHKQFTGCKSDWEVLSAAELGLIFIFALEVLHPSSDITEVDEVRLAAQVFREKVTVVLAWRRATARGVSPELDAMQMMLWHILHFLCKLYEYYELYEK